MVVTLENNVIMKHISGNSIANHFKEQYSKPLSTVRKYLYLITFAENLELVYSHSTSQSKQKPKQSQSKHLYFSKDTSFS